MSKPKFKFELNKSEVRHLLRSEPVLAECRKHGSKILSKALASSPGYEMEDRHYPERNGVSIFPGDGDSAIDNAINETLLRSRGF